MLDALTREVAQLPCCAIVIARTRLTMARACVVALPDARNRAAVADAERALIAAAMGEPIPTPIGETDGTQA